MESYRMGEESYFRWNTGRVTLKRRYLSQGLKDEKILTTQSEGQCVLNRKQYVPRPRGETASQHGAQCQTTLSLVRIFYFTFQFIFFLFPHQIFQFPVLLRPAPKSVSSFSQVTSALDSLRRWSQCSFLYHQVSLHGHTQFLPFSLFWRASLIAQLVKISL